MTERQMTKRRKVLNVERLNIKFERRKNERQKIFYTIYDLFLSSVIIPKVGSFDPTWGMTTELKNLNFKHSPYYPQL
jgi:hypothetical protein